MASGKTRRPRAVQACALAALLMCAPAAAQEAPPKDNNDESVAGALAPVDASEEPQPKAGSGFRSIWTSGGSDIYVPGYIWHLPYKYSPEQIARYNTAAWGLGYGRTLRGSGANHPRSLFAIVSADSYSRPQYMLGYSWRARWHPGGGPFALGGGYSALVVGREDKFNYAPLPGLDLFSALKPVQDSVAIHAFKLLEEGFGFRAGIQCLLKIIRHSRMALRFISRIPAAIVFCPFDFAQARLAHPALLDQRNGFLPIDS